MTVTTSGYAVSNLAVIMPPKNKPRRWRQNFIREWREFRGMTQQDMADRIGRTKATVSRIETGDIAYTREFLEAAADALGTHPGMLLLRAPAEADALPAQKRR